MGECKFQDPQRGMDASEHDRNKQLEIQDKQQHG